MGGFFERGQHGPCKVRIGPSRRTHLSRMNRNQKGNTSPSAVRENLDDPPIHIRPIVPASAGAEDKNPVGSGHYDKPSIAPRRLNRNGFLCRKCQESVGKGLNEWFQGPLPLVGSRGKSQVTPHPGQAPSPDTAPDA